MSHAARYSKAMSENLPSTHVALIGAGPIGLETAIELKKAKCDYLHFEKGQIASTIMRYPPGTIYFSSPERISIAGFPIPIVGQTKATKEQYIAYLRSVATAYDLPIQTYEPVERIERLPAGGFVLHTTTAHGSVQHAYRATNIILAVGDMEFPRRLGIPGEDLAHVSYYLEEPHTYFGRRVLIVGGKNSAAESALRCYRAGARVAISYRQSQFDDQSLKYWIYPELRGLVERGAIEAHLRTCPVRISPTHVTLRPLDEGDASAEREIPADFVVMQTGYRPDQTLLDQIGVELNGEQQAPVCDRDTMETNVPGVYVAGTAVAGEQLRFRLFIENCHIHAHRIVHALTGQPPPSAENPWSLPET